MSFPATITLKDAAAASAVFNRLRSDSNKVDYALASSTLQEPVMLRIGQQPAASPTGVNRHLAKFHRIKMDAASKKTVPLVMNVTISRPLDLVAEADVNDLCAYACEFFKSPTLVAAFLRGEL